MIELEETEQTINLEDITLFESNNKIVLPRSYINHVLKFNGGYPVYETYFKEYSFEGFTPIKFGDYHIEKRIKNLDKFLSNDHIPIGDCNGGILLMCLNENEYGRIYVTFSDGQTDFLADSFEEFLDGLSEEREE